MTEAWSLPAPPWIPLASGARVELGALRPEQVTIDDIAHHLARLCRWGGACPVHYSVAEHSYRVFELVAMLGADRRTQRQALLHDAEEFVAGDIRRPIKQRHPDIFGPMEAQHWGVIAQVFDVPTELAPIVKEADERICATELRDLFGKATAKERREYGIELPPLDAERVNFGWSIASAEVLFGEGLKELCEAGS